MKPTHNQKEHIKNVFQQMESKSDFLDLLNYSKNICYGKQYVPFEMIQLNRYINVNASPKTEWENINFSKFRKRQENYIDFRIPKKSGETRTISAPKKGLKAFQKALNLILQCVHEPHKNATGFVPNKSIVDNARKHVGQNYVYNIDLKNFFPSIPLERIWGRLEVKPFNLGSSLNRKKIAGMIAIISCKKINLVNPNAWRDNATGLEEDEEIWILPQGAPTSPTLSNAICDRFDLLMTGVAKRFGLNYSRYADDITFSSMHNTYKKSNKEVEELYKQGNTFDIEIRRIIKSQNFKVNEQKVRLQKKGYRQEVTGIITNEHLNVHQTYIKEIRSWIYKWETYGYDKTKKLFQSHYVFKNKLENKKVPEFSMVIEGKLLYLKMIKGANDSTYLKLNSRFENLSQNEDKLEQILKTWELDGIEKAMELYANKI